MKKSIYPNMKVERTTYSFSFTCILTDCMLFGHYSRNKSN